MIINFKKSGFTLIELIALIMIIVIIFIIAIPIMVGIINDTYKQTVKKSAYKALDAIIEYYTELISQDTLTSLPLTIDFTIASDVNKLKIPSMIPTSGVVTLGINGKFTSVSNLAIDGYVCTYDATKQVFIECTK